MLAKLMGAQIKMNRRDIPELKNLSDKDMEDIDLSPSGATIELETANIYIEAASVLENYIKLIKNVGAGGVIADFIEKI